MVQLSLHEIQASSAVPLQAVVFNLLLPSPGDASFLQELLLIFSQCPSVPCSLTCSGTVISSCPPRPGTAGICSLQCNAHASVGLSCARSSALSYPAFGKALRAFLRAQKGWQDDREASETGNGDYIHKCSLQAQAQHLGRV